MSRNPLSRPRLTAKGLTYSLAFDGVDDLAASVANAGITGSEACSIVGWIKTQQLITANGVGYIIAGTLSALGPGIGPGIFAVGNNAGNAVQVPHINTTTYYKAPVNEWVHLGVSYAGGVGGAFKLYVGGAVKFTGTVTGAADDGKIQIGGAPVTSPAITLYTQTKYGPLAVYSGALTDEDFENIFATQDYPEENAIGIYPMSDGPGATQITDISGNDNHLIITGAPVWSDSDLPVIGRSVSSERTAITEDRIAA